jgi:hypothetical protein
MERRSDRRRSAPVRQVWVGLFLLFCVDGDRRVIGEMDCRCIIALLIIDDVSRTDGGYELLRMDSGFAFGGDDRKQASVESCQGNCLLISFPRSSRIVSFPRI